MIEKILRRMRPRIVTILLLSFSVLVIPALLVVLTVSHYQTEEAIRDHLDEELGRTKSYTEIAVRGFFGPLIHLGNSLASVAAVDRDLVVQDSFDEVLFRNLAQDETIVSLTIAFEDGFARNFSRITPEMRAQNQEYPELAQWVGRTVRRSNEGSQESYRQTFYSDFPQTIPVDAPLRVPDFLDTESYRGVRSSKNIFITEATTGAASGIPIVGVAVPILKDGAFFGAVSSNVTVSRLSEFLFNNRLSENSESMFLGPGGQIVALSRLPQTEGLTGTRVQELELVQQRIMTIDALQGGLPDADDTGVNSFSADINGTEYLVADFPVSNRYGLTYRAIILSPLNDFVGDLRRFSRNFSIIILVLLVLEAFLMVHIARKMARRIRALSSTIGRIRCMEFDDESDSLPPPLIREIKELHNGISLLQSALRSFALYVPLDVVRKMVDEGKAIAPGVERREMTILFCDLENFSTLAQDIPAEQLLEYSTEYFSIATQAITRHGGTVDKFIGDAVMGFWGAPQSVSDHAVRACKAAVDIVRGLEQANMRWGLDGKRTLRVRVGINSASVLVGNIGSPDRLSYTALGDGVNVASRLEGKNKELGTSICISDSTYERAKDRIVARPIKPVSVKGRIGEFMVYELLDVES